MAYSDFTMSDLENQFGIRHERNKLQFDIEPIQPSEWLRADLEVAEDLSLNNRKARSEWIVAPLLKELLTINDNFFVVYSGESLSADLNRGLEGVCDFTLAKNVYTVDIRCPLIQIVEAEKNDLELGITQCAAQIVGAKVFNQKRNTYPDRLYGCITDADSWLFMKLEEDEITVDTQKYQLANLPELLGAFQSITDYYKEHLN